MGDIGAGRGAVNLSYLSRDLIDPMSIDVAIRSAQEEGFVGIHHYYSTGDSTLGLPGDTFQQWEYKPISNILVHDCHLRGSSPHLRLVLQCAVIIHECINQC